MLEVNTELVLAAGYYRTCWTDFQGKRGDVVGVPPPHAPRPGETGAEGADVRGRSALRGLVRIVEVEFVEVGG